jgi:hypothetical protein
MKAHTTQLGNDMHVYSLTVTTFPINKIITSAIITSYQADKFYSEIYDILEKDFDVIMTIVDRFSKKWLI